MEITLLFGLIILNGIFAMSEIALVTARKGRLMKLASAGYWKGFLERYTSYDTSLVSDAIRPVESVLPS